MGDIWLYAVSDQESLDILRRNNINSALISELNKEEVSKSYNLVIMYDQDPYLDKEKERPGYKKAIAIARWFFNKRKNKIYLLQLPKPADFEGSFRFSDWYKIHSESKEEKDPLEKVIKGMIASRSCPYFPGWEYLGHFERMQRHHLCFLETSEKHFDLDQARKLLLSKFDSLFLDLNLNQMLFSAAECSAAIQYFTENIFKCQKRTNDPMEPPK